MNKINNKKKQKLITAGFLLALFILIIIILSSTMVLGYEPEDRPNIIKRALQSWGNSLTHWLPFVDRESDQDADIYDWYNDTFFTLDRWEMDVCLMDLSTNVREFRDSTNSYTFVYDDNLYTTTISLSAKREYFNETEWLYKLSWYLMPYRFDLPYRVYLVDDERNIFYPPNDDDAWMTAVVYSGDSGYEAFYSPRSFAQAVEAGRGAYEAGLGKKSSEASASSPLTGLDFIKS